METKKNVEVSDAEIKAAVEVVEKIFGKGQTLKDIRGFDDAQMETIYSLGFNLYQSGRHEDAEKVFKLLTLLDYSEVKYWLGFGAVQQAQRKFAQAVKSYAMGMMIDMHEPRLAYHAAECYLALGDKANAESALLAVEEFAPATSEYRAKAAELKKSLAA